MAVRDAELLKRQTVEGGPKAQGIERATDLLLPPERIADRLRHFAEEVYDTSPESHISRFMKVLLGDAGVGQIRKRLTVTRLQQSLQGTHFFDLDRFYGALFALRRHSYEKYLTNPYADTVTTDQWQEIRTKDTSYRSRVEQFGRAITYGPTPTGIELASEAVLSVDCDVLESYYQADVGFQTYAEIEAQYGDGSGQDYGDMDGISYADLEGSPLPRLESQRREFVVRPKRPITLEESYNLSRVLDRIKPVDSRYVIDDQGIVLHEEVALRGAWADSTYWEVLSYVASRPSTAIDPYLISSADPTEQPRPPFSGYQGEAWSYNGVIAGASAYSIDQYGPLLMPTQRIVFADGSFYDYAASAAVMPQRYVQSGRSVSDAILMAHPYAMARTPAPTIEAERQARKTLATVYADHIPLDDLVEALKQTQFPTFQETLAQRYWVTPERDGTDPTIEAIEVRLATPRLMNYIAFEVAHYPHSIAVEVYDEGQGTWRQVYYDVISDSLPAFVNPSVLDPRVGHPLHSFPGHWQRYSFRVDPVTTSRIRLTLRRTSGAQPRLAVFGRGLNPRYIPYSLAVRNVDMGYRITKRGDVDLANEAIGATTDVLGSLVEFRLREEPVSNLLVDTAAVWRSEPQPVNYAVVNLYLDTRDEYGLGQTIDRFHLDPTHSGAHITIYWSDDEGEPEDESFFNDVVWTPFPRDYLLQKGYVHIPPTRARWFKFEFTNLTAEPYEAFLPIIRTVKLFPQTRVDEYRRRQQGVAREAMPEGLAASVDVRTAPLFRDGRYLSLRPDVSGTYPTEAIYATDPTATLRLRALDFNFGMATWHQENDAPRFSFSDRHIYEQVEVRHTAKVAYFVGLRSIEAYRVDFEADEDTQVYIDHFWDTHNLAPGFTWNFDPNVLYAAYADSVVTSRLLGSNSNVWALQFATQQTEAVQIAPDADFVNPALATYTWNDPNSWQQVGDAYVTWMPNEQSVYNARHVIPPQRTLAAFSGPMRPVLQPVFSYRERLVEDLEAAQALSGGIVSPNLQPSNDVRIYAAARVILDTDLTSPLTLQILAGNNDAVLAEKEITGHKGEMLEWYVGHDMGVIYHPPPAPTRYEFKSLISPPINELIGDPAEEIVDPAGPPQEASDDTVRIRLIQRGKSDDAWRVDNLSLFDEGIVWEFSVNGGSEWISARGIRNNQHGVLVFSAPGNQLVWRARGMRAHVAIDSLKIRPWYIGNKNSRQSGTMRGPNVSTYDHDPPIYADPDFTTWTIPIPRGWWYANRRYHRLLPVEGLPNVTPFRRQFARTATDDVSAHAGTMTWGSLRDQRWAQIEDDTWGEIGTSGGARDEAEGEVF